MSSSLCQHEGRVHPTQHLLRPAIEASVLPQQGKLKFSFFEDMQSVEMTFVHHTSLLSTWLDS